MYNMHSTSIQHCVNVLKAHRSITYHRVLGSDKLHNALEDCFVLLHVFLQGKALQQYRNHLDKQKKHLCHEKIIKCKINA